jgi:hypothetical protein
MARRERGFFLASSGLFLLSRVRRILAARANPAGQSMYLSSLRGECDALWGRGTEMACVSACGRVLDMPAGIIDGV